MVRDSRVHSDTITMIIRVPVLSLLSPLDRDHHGKVKSVSQPFRLEFLALSDKFSNKYFSKNSKRPG